MEHLTPIGVEHWLFVALLAVHVLAYGIKTIREALKD